MRFLRDSDSGLIIPRERRVCAPRKRLCSMGASQQILLAGGSAGSGSSDPLFSSVSLLLHCEGSNGGTTFTDSSSNGHTVTASGATTSTAWSKFGSASALISSGASNQNRLTVPNHASLNFGTGDFTIEFWMYLISVQTALCVCKTAGTGFYPFQVYIATNKIAFRCYTNSGANLPSVVGTTTLSTGVNYFVQARRRNAGGIANYELALNGTQEAATTDTISFSVYDNTDVLVLGNYNSGAQFPLVGYIDDMRLTKGSARTFAVPSQAFPDS